ncbi:MAG: hypothetical protein HYX78_05830 [Armatimonadetes bacterium]|nr:hypothetical protein [Armatimonadota bacterium]
MRKAATGLLLAAFVLALLLPAWGGDVEPPRYFGPGVGYKDFGSSKYFRTYYPPEKWEKYGYGTGHMGMGYGPYIYSGPRTERPVFDRPDFATPLVKPRLKWIGGNQVRVITPSSAGNIQQLQVDVLAFNGAVLHTGTAVRAPYEIVALLPEGAASIRVRINLVDGFSAVVFPIVPVK